MRKTAFALVFVALLCGINVEIYAKPDIAPYTIMIYMNGSDLESESGLATVDLLEMLESGLDSALCNLILFTGGTLRWFNDIVPPVDCVIWEVSDGYITELENWGAQNMGDPKTLSEFIRYTMKNYPARKTGLIMWDHGGGSIAGFGHDEVFDEDNLSLTDMALAFEWANLGEDKLEFIGFDSCLMATVEMAVIASRYADFLIASEDLEPGEGWDYTFLRELNINPDIDGAALGAHIVDYFIDFFEGCDDEILTLSVTDLSKAADVMHSLGDLTRSMSRNLEEDEVPAFRTFAVRRRHTKTFGLGSPRDSESDMVDIGSLAQSLADIFPDEAAAVGKALDSAILYNRHNSDTPLSGLASYYIYGGKKTADVSLSTYQALGMSEEYTKYLENFAALLLSGIYAEIKNADAALLQHIGGGTHVYAGIQRSDGFRGPDESLWPAIGGLHVSLYEINSTDRAAYYAIPARLNGKDCDIIAVFTEDAPYGKILGARMEFGYILQKGYEKVVPGDTLAFYYKIHGGGDEDGGFVLGEEFAVTEELMLDWVLPDWETTMPGVFVRRK